MAKNDDELEAITRTARKTTWDHWQEVIDAREEEDNPHTDLLKNRQKQKLTECSTHMQNQMSKLFEQADAQSLSDHKIKKIDPMTSTSTPERKTTWDHRKEEELNNPHADLLKKQKMMERSTTHAESQMSKLFEQADTQPLSDHKSKKIDSITSTRESKTIWDHWEEVADAIEKLLNDPDNDLLENHLMQKLMVLATHSQSELAKLFEQDDTQLLLYKIKELGEAHHPKALMIGFYLTGIFGSIAGAGVGCWPSIAGVTGNAAKSYQAISGGIQGVLGQGSQNMANLFQTKNQGEITELSQLLELHKTQQNSHKQEFERQQQIAQRHAEDKKNGEQKRHETIDRVNNG